MNNKHVIIDDTAEIIQYYRLIYCRYKNSPCSSRFAASRGCCNSSVISYFVPFSSNGSLYTIYKPMFVYLSCFLFFVISFCVSLLFIYSLLVVIFFVVYFVYILRYLLYRDLILINYIIYKKGCTLIA